MADAITALTHPEVVGAKRWTLRGVTAYRSPEGPFQVLRLPVSGLEDAASVLLQVPQHVYVVRGRANATVIPYRRHRGDAPTIEPEAHQLLPIDWDGEDTDLRTDLDVAAAEVRSLLPPEFARAKCLAVATSSAGVEIAARSRRPAIPTRPPSRLGRAAPGTVANRPARAAGSRGRVSTCWIVLASRRRARRPGAGARLRRDGAHASARIPRAHRPSSARVRFRSADAS